MDPKYCYWCYCGPLLFKWILSIDDVHRCRFTEMRKVPPPSDEIVSEALFSALLAAHRPAFTTAATKYNGLLLFLPWPLVLLMGLCGWSARDGEDGRRFTREIVCIIISIGTLLLLLMLFGLKRRPVLAAHELALSNGRPAIPLLAPINIGLRKFMIMLAHWILNRPIIYVETHRPLSSNYNCAKGITLEFAFSSWPVWFIGYVVDGLIIQLGRISLPTHHRNRIRLAIFPLWLLINNAERVIILNILITTIE